MKNNELITTSNSLKSLHVQIQIGEKLLAINNINKQKELLLELSKYFNVSLKKIVFRNCHIDEAILIKNANKIDWHYLSYNNKINWSIELIDKFINNWDWKGLSSNTAIIKSKEIITNYFDKWDWELISEKINEELLDNLIEEQKDNLDWEILSNNDRWSIEIISNFKKYWNWSILSGQDSAVQFNIETIRKFKKYWNWSILSSSYGYINYNTLLEFKDYWDFEALKENSNFRWSDNLIDEYLSNKNIEIFKDTYQDYFKYKGVYDYEYINDRLYWEESHIILNKEYYDWEVLSLNPSLPWSESFIDQLEKFIDWKYLSWNQDIPWSSELIHKYLDRWDWTYLSNNPMLPWSVSLYYEFKDYWVEESFWWSKKLNWDKTFTYDESRSYVDFGYYNKYKRKFDTEFLEFIKDSFNWCELSFSNCFDWSEEIINEYSDYLNWERIQRSLHRKDSFFCSLDFLDKHKDKFKEWLSNDEYYRDKFLVFKRLLLEVLDDDLVIKIIEDPSIQ